MPKRVTGEEYLSRAKAVHGDKYDYSRTVYRNMHTKVVIICPIHGEFLQEAQAHLVGQGCPECGKEKQKQTVLYKYGVDNPMKSPEICAKARQTCVEKYGAQWAMSTKKVRAKVCATNMARYGAENPIQNAEIREKIRRTVASRYGTPFLGQVNAFREKARKTCLLRYGKEEPLAVKSIHKKIDAAKSENGTFSSSQSE